MANNIYWQEYQEQLKTFWKEHQTELKAAWRKMSKNVRQVYSFGDFVWEVFVTARGGK